MDILHIEGEPPMGLRAHRPVKGQLFHVPQEAAHTSWNQFSRRAQITVLSAITLIGLALMVAGIMH